MKPIITALLLVMTGCTLEPAVHGKVVGNSHGMYFAQPDTEHVKPDARKQVSHGGEY